ncbi:MAG: NAD(+)/NADH kinase [Clostridia bacterium]|nr:NAD(+)/NADH kinase [Clostridia bacterium]
MKIILYANNNKPDNVERMLKLGGIAAKHGVECVCIKSGEDLFGLSDEAWEDVFLIVSVGGDGTILRAASAAAAYDKPVLGINMGRIGFFSEIGSDDFESALLKLSRGEYSVENASMLNCRLNGKLMGACLNDFVIHRQELSSITHFDLEIDGDTVGNVMADGLIVGTPAGSTAYTMSAGGPVVAPKLDCILATPICPHSLTVRPIVASVMSEIIVRIKCTCRLSMDGQDIRVLVPGDELRFSHSEKTARFIRFDNRNVFRLIREKLR